MATGDRSDIVSRLAATLPPWFPNPPNAPVLNAILQATADSFSSAYDLLGGAFRESRIATAAAGFLDLAAWDYFGGGFVRRQDETDASFQARILKELVRPRQTRAAIIEMLQDLTGVAPVVREPWNPEDYGGYGGYTCGYGIGLGYGSLALPYQIFIDAYTPGQGIPLIAGYGENYGGYGSVLSNAAYADLSQVSGPVTNAEIYQRIGETIAAGITAWTNITVAGQTFATVGQLIFNAPQQSMLIGVL